VAERPQTGKDIREAEALMSNSQSTDDTHAGRGGSTVSGQRDWLQITLASIGDGVITADAKGCVNYLNPVAELLTGWSLADAAGKAVEQVFRIIHETTRQPVEQPVRKVIERGLTTGLGNHTLLIARDGSERPIDDSAAAIKDAQGNVVGVVLIFRDITERREAELRAERAKEYAESIVVTVREPMLVLDARLHVQSANRSFYRTFQVNPAETEGRFIYDLGDGQWDIPALRKLLEEIVPRDSAFDDFEVEHDFEHIGRKTMLLNARRFPPEGRHELVLLAIEDITDRKRMAHDLTTSEIRYRRLFEAAHDGILLIDPGTRRITDANPFLVELLGYPRDELVGKELWEIGLLRDEVVSREAFRTLKETGSIRYEDLPLRSKDGKRREVEFVSNVYKEDGRDVIQCNIRDITDRMRMEDERKRHQQATEAARDRAEANETQLADADLRKNEFLAMLAHELRNPLAAVQNAVAVATRSGTTENLEWSRDVTARQVANFARLINDLLDVSRITQGKIHLQKALIDATPVLHYAVAAVRPLVEERKHELLLTFASTDLKLEADSTRVEQILVNLLSNAAKYTPSGGRIQLIAGAEGNEVVFRVRDNGVGIPPELLPRMFQLFAQGDRSLARSEGGLGIGLTLVRSLAELHGGTVTATSGGTGKGSEFVLRLPAAQGLTPAAAVPAGGPAGSPVRRLRVLVVEDIVDTAKGMAELLKLADDDVWVAYSGEEAILAAREHRPEVILLDIGLPGMDGYELASRLRQEECGRDTVLIALSGYGGDEALRRSQEAGIDHHLLKPVDFDALLALINRPHRVT
jgi:PAS domain S-box-containing protein